MKENFDELIHKIQTEMPELITPDLLVQLGLADHVRLFRIRQSGAIPYIKLSSARILYLKNDVIEWLKKCYHDSNNVDSKECLNNAYKA